MTIPPDPSCRLGLVRAFVMLVLSVVGCAGAIPGDSDAEAADPWISPAALAWSAKDDTVFVASPTSGEVLLVDAATRKVRQTLRAPGTPSGLVLSPDDRFLYVTCSGPESTLWVVDSRTGREIRRIRLGAGALAPVLSGDGATAYVCLRYEGAVAVVDLAKAEVTRRLAAEREPVAAALTPDGRRLLVANHLPLGRADAGVVSAHVTVLDLAEGKVLRQLALPNGGNLIRDVRVSPDGRHACVTHILARFQLPTTQVERGWMNGSALTVIELATLTSVGTVLLDQVEHGTANPWAAAWAGDGTNLLVTHAGTHELSVIDFPGLMRKLARPPPGGVGKPVPTGYPTEEEVTDLTFLSGLRQLIGLGGNGPRCLVTKGNRALVGNYFSESLTAIDLASTSTPVRATPWPLHTARPMSVRRRGEAYFNDATLCLESWQSCASCHSSEGRMDALNWDLMNDGKGNAKNTKSLVLAHVTAPAMSLGIRTNAEAAVRAGIHHILFTVQPPEVPDAIDHWLAGLNPEPSPHLIDGQLSAAARRGRLLFEDPTVGCAVCHPPPLYTNRGSFDVGTLAPTEGAAVELDTPTLLEAWRTAPYLHDGSAATLKEVLEERNVRDQHGRTSQLEPAELDDLVAFLLSLPISP